MDNYQEYVDKIKKLRIEKDEVMKKYQGFNAEIRNSIDELTNKVKKDLELELSKKLKPVLVDKNYKIKYRSNRLPTNIGETYFLLNDEIGVYIYIENKTTIKPQIITFLKTKNDNIRFSIANSSKLAWDISFNFNKYTIETYIDATINTLNKAYEAKKQRELKRIANKYNL